MQGAKFFNTESQVSNQNFPQYVLRRKTQLGTYVGKLDSHINKAMNFQGRIISRKKKNLLDTLQNMKDQIYKQSEKTRKMQQFFYEHCQKLLQQDIDKWDHNKDFFTKMFQFYDLKIKQKKGYIKQKKNEVEKKTIQLKQIMRNSRRYLTIQQLSQKISTQIKLRSQSKSKKLTQTQDSQTNRKMIRVKTQSSLPALNKNTRLKTTLDFQQENRASYCEDGSVKNYMKPIKTQKKIYLNPQYQRYDLFEMLSWYRKDKIQYNWFQKLIFVQRNFKKITQALNKPL